MQSLALCVAHLGTSTAPARHHLGTSTAPPQVAAGATQYYLTTQELPELRGGGEQLVGPPLTRLGG